MKNPILLDIPDHYETERLHIRVMQPGDSAITHPAIVESAAEVGRWLSWANPVQTLDETEAFNRGAFAAFMARDYFHFHIFRRADNQFAGSISLGPVNWQVPTFEIGYWLRTSLTGNGYMTEAVRGLMQFALEHLQACRLEIMCDVNNRASAVVAERCGFTLEARTHNDFRDTAGQLTDSLLYGWNTAEPDSGRPPEPRQPASTHPILLDIPDQLESERLILRPPQPGDGLVINAAVQATAESLHRWMPWMKHGQSIDDSESFARRTAIAFQRRESFGFGLIHKTSGDYLGSTGLFNLDWDIPSGEIGYWLHVDYQGQGYMTEAVNRLTAFAFDDLKLERVEIRCDARNQASASVARRSDYTQEAHLHHHRRGVNGELVNTLIFAKLRGDNDA